MILYYTGTGNSEYVAHKIAEALSDDTCNLFDFIRRSNHHDISSKRPWVVVVPTYAWQIPHIVRDWLLHTRLRGNREIYFIMTCGDSNGAAGKHLRKLCKKKNLLYKGCASILMPENYIALFRAPDNDTARRLIHASDALIRQAVEKIQKGLTIKEKKYSLMDRFLSGPVNRIFYRFIVKSKKFYAKDSCISCGLCEKVCPLSNITLTGGKPSWGEDCTHCMSCICKCPKEAIEYGRSSKGKIRYTFQKVQSNNL